MPRCQLTGRGGREESRGGCSRSRSTSVARYEGKEHDCYASAPDICQRSSVASCHHHSVRKLEPACAPRCSQPPACPQTVCPQPVCPQPVCPQPVPTCAQQCPPPCPAPPPPQPMMCAPPAINTTAYCPYNDQTYGGFAPPPPPVSTSVPPVVVERINGGDMCPGGCFGGSSNQMDTYGTGGYSTGGYGTGGGGMDMCGGGMGGNSCQCCAMLICSLLVIIGLALGLGLGLGLPA